MSAVGSQEARIPFGVWLFTQIRSAIGIVFIIPYTIFCSVYAITVGLLGMTRAATLLICTWSRTLLFIFGIRVDARDEPNIPSEGGGILVFNHQSLFDIPVIVSSTEKNIRFGAKIELFKIPFFGPAMRAVGTLPIARENRREVMRIYQEAAARFAENICFVLAPEGTRQKEPQIGRFKKGPFIFAVNAGVPIIPAVIKGAHSVLPKKSLNINVGRMSRTIYLQYLPPVETKGLSLDAVDELVEKVRAQMVACYENLPT